MLKALVLVCSVAITPDLRTCDQNNAVDVVLVPEEFGSPAMCFMHGQAYLAQTELGRQLTTDDRLKVTCSPTKKVEAIGRTSVLR